ncbi:MAG: methyl-accepting chemotaxis protein [Oligoflexales bacterium]
MLDNSNGSELDKDEFNMIDFTESRWFKESQKNEFTENESWGISNVFVDKTEIISDFSDANLPPFLGFPIATHVFDRKGQLTGILVGFIDFSSFVNLGKRYINKEINSGIESARVVIMNKEGSILANIYGSSSIVGTSTKTEQTEQTEQKTNKQGKANKGIEIVNNLKDEKYFENLKALNFYPSLLANESKSMAYHDNHSREDLIVGYSSLDDKSFLRNTEWKVLFQAKESEVLRLLLALEKENILITVLLFLAFLLICSYFIGRITVMFAKVANKLKVSAEHASNTSNILKKTSTEVFKSCEKQSAALQETIASLAEISGTMKQTWNNVKNCNDIMKQMSEKIEVGHTTMRNMMESMQGIKTNNANLEDISNIMTSISEKTSVINDIVFKTKLLAFNASIEAVRAGDKGEGFAVVADEVRGLAELSGEAAKEIGILLTESNKQVKDIIDTSSERTQYGLQATEEATSFFKGFAEDVTQIKENVENIEIATSEQQSGIKQTDKAMRMMEQATKRNYDETQESLSVASSLFKQSSMITNIMHIINLLVHGSFQFLKRSKKRKKKKDLFEQMLENNQPLNNDEDESNIIPIKQATKDLESSESNSQATDEINEEFSNSESGSSKSINLLKVKNTMKDFLEKKSDDNQEELTEAKSETKIDKKSSTKKAKVKTL